MAMCEGWKEKYHLPKLQFNFETRAGFMLHIKREDLKTSTNAHANNNHGLPKFFTNIASTFTMIKSENIQ